MPGERDRIKTDREICSSSSDKKLKNNMMNSLSSEVIWSFCLVKSISDFFITIYMVVMLQGLIYDQIRE